jgi:hypothetical protein
MIHRRKMRVFARRDAASPTTAARAGRQGDACTRNVLSPSTDLQANPTEPVRTQGAVYSVDTRSSSSPLPSPLCCLLHSGLRLSCVHTGRESNRSFVVERTYRGSFSRKRGSGQTDWVLVNCVPSILRRYFHVHIGPGLRLRTPTRRGARHQTTSSTRPSASLHHFQLLRQIP